MFNSNIEYEKNERYLTGFSCLFNIVVIETSFIIFNILHNMETQNFHFCFVLTKNISSELQSTKQYTQI